MIKEGDFRCGGEDKGLEEGYKGEWLEEDNGWISPQLRIQAVFLSRWSKALVGRSAGGEATSTHVGMLEWEWTISCMTLGHKGHVKTLRLSMVMRLDVFSLPLFGCWGYNNWGLPTFRGLCIGTSMHMVRLTSTKIVCVSRLSPWIYHRLVWFGFTGSLVEGVSVARGNHVYRSKLIECTSIYRSHTN